MRRRRFVAAAPAFVWPAGLRPAAARAATPAQRDAATGVRAALERGALSALSLLGRTDGFLGNPQVRIELPGALDEAAKLLRLAGQSRRVDALVTAMNRAAEAAVPHAKDMLVAAVRSIGVDDALRIVRGGDTAATEFFAAKTRQPLGERFLPIVTRETERVSLSEKYNAVAGRAAGFGLLRRDEATVQQYVTGKALDGLYFMIGEEERKIRRDPLATGSAVLQKVFGAPR